MYKIAIDVMGGDNAPDAILNGCKDALNKFNDINLRLFGNKEIIDRFIDIKNVDRSRVEVIGTTQVITNDESPVNAIRKKTDSSLVKAMQSVADKETQGFVSAGSTGAVLAGATFIVKRLPGVSRPALSPLLPSVKGGKVMLVDCGANVDCKPAYLQQFAIMGSTYMNKVKGIKNPRVGLINNGAEEGKGNKLTKEAYELLKTTPVNFIGNCEAREAISGDFDVIVTDGFVGNVLLKTLEGVAGGIMKMLKESLMSSFKTKLGAMLSKDAFADLKKKMDHDEEGGAALLGVNGEIVKAHGSSNAYAFMNAIGQVRLCIKNNVSQTLLEGIKSIEQEV